MWSHLKKWIGTGLRGFQAGAEAVGIGVDRVGDWSMQAMGSLLRSPTLAVAIATAILFVAARIPTELFYGSFGVRPEDVGLNSVQVLLQGSAVTLGLSVLIGALFGLLVVVTVAAGAGIYALVVGRAFSKKPKGYVQRTVRRALRPGALLVPIISIVLATALLILTAIDDAKTVGSGKPLEVLFVPWKAEAVKARWNLPSGHFRLPGCRWLYYLGEGDNRVVLYNAWRGKSYQIDSADVQLEFPLEC